MRRAILMSKYDHPSSGDLDHQKFLFEAPKGLGLDYIRWLEWRVDDLAAHCRINSSNHNYLRAKYEALDAQLKKMTEVKVDG
jgi:hypothetical protein